MNVIEGDLLRLALDGRFDVVVHGCNCHCGMGKGIALSIKQQFPEAYEADQRTAKGDRAKLGTMSTAVVERPPARFTVVNAYTQIHWRGEGVLADYDAIRSAFKAVKRQFAGRRIGYPRIGAGLAKGDWSVIARVIDEELAARTTRWSSLFRRPRGRRRWRDDRRNVPLADPTIGNIPSCTCALPSRLSHG